MVPPNYGLEECYDAKKQKRVCITEATTDWLIETEAYIQELEAAAFWETD